MDLSIITVTWNAEKEIGRQIKSVISGCKNISFEQIIIDNASKDKTIEIIEQDFSQVKLIKNNKNTGFGFPNNQGAKISTGEFLLFLNPDMQVKEGSLDKMVEWMRKHPEVGLASCKLIDEQGNFNVEARPRRFPKVWEMLVLIFKIPHLLPQILNNYYMKDFDSNKEQEVPSVRGSFMMMRREVYEKLGWAFDPRYFIWFEDVDICREVWQAGYKVVYTPIVSCVDFIGQSFKKRANYWKQKNFTRSMLTYFQKWEPWYKWIWIAIARPFGLVLAWINDKISNLSG
jgi:hypothetical protein